MRRTSNTLAKLIPQATPGCPHVLGTWVTRTSKSTANYDDGNERPAGHRGGRLVRSGAPCQFTPGHRGQHRTADGRAWS